MREERQTDRHSLREDDRGEGWGVGTEGGGGGGEDGVSSRHPTSLWMIPQSDSLRWLRIFPKPDREQSDRGVPVTHTV